MIRPTCAEAGRVMTSLDAARFDRLVRVVMGLRTPAELKGPLSARRQMKMYCYEWLAHLGFLGEDKVRWLLSLLEGPLGLFADEVDRDYHLFRDSRKPCAVFTIDVIDKRYAAWPGAEAFADLSEECPIVELPEAGCTHVVCDVLAVFNAKQKWLARLQGGAGGRQHHGPAGGAGPGDG